MAHKVHLYADSDAKGALRFASRMRVTLTGGRVVETYAKYPEGSSKNPLPKAKIYDKFRKIASTVIPEERIEKVISMVENIEQVRDVSLLISLMVK